MNGQVYLYLKKADQAPVKTCEEAIRYARDYGHDIMIIDTAGRLQIDEELMNESA